MAADTLEALRLLPRALGGLRDTGLLRGLPPRAMARFAGDLRRTGLTAAALCHLAAARAPERAAIVDDDGELSWGELNRRVLRLRAGLRARHGVGAGSTVAILCRNHRGFAEAVWASASLGAEVLLLNTDFPAPQLGQVLERHAVTGLICDEEFLPLLREAGYPGSPVVADRMQSETNDTLAELIASDFPEPGRAAARPRFTLLTSGTSGVPKGAPRSTPRPLATIGPLVSLLDRIPLEPGSRLLVLPPLFHGFGFAFMIMGAALAGTVVVRRRFDASQALADLENSGATMAVGVPVMFQRMLAEAGDRPVRHRLRVLVSAAAPLGPALSERLIAGFGPVVFNIYGSSEAGLITLATPRDLRACPGCVGRPLAGTRLALLDEKLQPVPEGETGRIYIGSGMLFDGYTGGGKREMHDGMMRTGDVGRLEQGRLFVEGRDDDMIVSGGENVYPREVEDTLAHHQAVEEAAVIGVPDEEFGQRLRAFVVCKADAIDDNEALEETLRAHVRARLARYKMPRDFVFVDELPRNPTGKVLRKTLAG